MDVSMPQLPKKNQHGRSLENFCQFLIAVVSLWKHVVMPIIHVHILSYCKPVKHRLQHRKMFPVSIPMIWWWYNGSAPQSLQITSDELTNRLSLSSIKNVMRCGCLRWYGYLYRMDQDTWPRKLDMAIVTCSNPRDHSRKTRLECIKKNLKAKSLEALLAQNRIAWHWALNSKSQCRHDNEVVQPKNNAH